MRQANGSKVRGRALEVVELLLDGDGQARLLLLQVRVKLLQLRGEALPRRRHLRRAVAHDAHAASLSRGAWRHPGPSHPHAAPPVPPQQRCLLATLLPLPQTVPHHHRRTSPRSTTAKAASLPVPAAMARSSLFFSSMRRLTYTCARPPRSQGSGQARNRPPATSPTATICVRGEQGARGSPAGCH